MIVFFRFQLVCQQFHREKVVCLPQLRSHVFTTAAVDNIDHNPSSTTARDSFHCTIISVIQHPSFFGEGTDQSLLILSGPKGGLTVCQRTTLRSPLLLAEMVVAIKRGH